MAIEDLLKTDKIRIGDIWTQAEVQPQEQPQEQARGQRVATESNKDIEATRLNATVEGLGFFRFQLGSGQLRPAVPPQPTQKSQKQRSLYKILRVITLLLSVITPLLLLAAVTFAIWLWAQGGQTPSIVSTSFKVFSFAFISSLLALGGATLFSLKIQLAELAQQIDPNPEVVIKKRKQTHHLSTSNETIIEQLKDIGQKYSGEEDWLIKWTEKCLEDDELKDRIRKEIKRLETEGQRVVKIEPDIIANGIAVTFVTEYRIPV